MVYRGSKGDDGQSVTGGPYTIGGPIPGNFAKPEYVKDIQTVWNKENANVGWVLTSESGARYFSENRSAETSYQFGGGLGVGKGPVSGGAEVAYSSHSGAGPPIALDARKPLLPQIGHGANAILREFDSRRASGTIAGVREGATLMGSPESIGSQIPNGLGGSTTVVDINAIVARSGEVKGWAYRGSDGEKYFQANNANRDAPSATLSVQVGPVGAGVGAAPAAIGPVERYKFGKGQVEGGNFLPIRRNFPTLDEGGLAMRPTEVRELRPGQSSTGTIIGASDQYVFQFGGRNIVYAHDIDKLGDAHPSVGQSATVAFRGETGLAVRVESQGLQQGRSLERG